MKLPIIALLAILLMISGCSQLPGLPKSKGQSIIATTQSVITDIKNPAPNSEAPSNHEFTPAIDVANMGDSDAEGVVCISGLDEGLFSGFTGCECQDFKIYADDKDGDTTQELEFGPYRIRTEDTQEAVMTAITRYSYKTTGTAKACIKKDLYSKTGCQTDDITKRKRNMLARSSSGAVLIDKVTETIIPVDKETVTLSFSIEVEKASEGDIYDSSKTIYPSCREEGKLNKEITGSIEGLPEGSVTCSSAELDEKGQGTLTCEAGNIRLTDSSGNFIFPGNNYEPEISIEINYGYEQKQSVKFKAAKKL